MSIFTRDCPVCAASHPINTVRCGCGYCFNPDKLDGVTQELEVISQEETLYRDYLAARATQAEEEWRFAKNAAAREPGNTVKSAEALLAEQTAMNARAELGAQDARAKAVKNRITVVRSNRRSRKAKAAAIPAPRPAPPSIRAALAPKPEKPAITAAPPPMPVVVSAPPKKMAPVAKPKIATPAPSSAQPKQQDRQAVAPSPPPRPVIVQVQPIATAPTPAFRNTQASKAQQIATTPAPVKSKSQDCPNCSGKVPANSQRCRCGYELPASANQMPSLAMSAEDSAAMLAALGINRDTGS